MKTFVTSLVLAALIAPLAACETHSTTEVRRNPLTGSTTYQDTTTTHNPVTGTTTVDQTKTRVR
jgi:hypothetical protein